MSKYFVHLLEKPELDATYDLNTHQTYDISGSLDFMLFFTQYLKALRLNYPEDYNYLLRGEVTIEYLNELWANAEYILEKSSEVMLNPDSPYNSVFTNSFFRDYGNYPPAIEVLKEVYSDDSLLELELVGIEHKQINYWADTYFSINN